MERVAAEAEQAWRVGARCHVAVDRQIASAVCHVLLSSGVEWLSSVVGLDIEGLSVI